MSKRVGTVTGALGVIVLLLLLIELPYLFGFLDGSTDAWNRRSLIGQAYGSVSAIISAVALAGVVVSLVVQRRQTRISSEYSLRQQHFALSKAALDDPDLLVCWGGDADLDLVRRRQLIYINLIATFWSSSWTVGDLPPRELDSMLRQSIFSTEIGRLWWERARVVRAEAHEGRLSRFDALIEATYQDVISGLQTDDDTERP